MFVVVLLLMYSSTADANGSECCHKAMGSCRSACEQLYLDAIADLETKQQRLLDVKNFCSSSLVQFWKCVNETQNKGDSKVWKSCCDHAVTDQCHDGCELAESTTELIHHCRQSDEMYLFDCVEIKQEREECCGLARKPECHNMCRHWVMSPSQVPKSLLSNTCSSPVINCLATLVPRVPLRQPHKYLHCCEHSNVGSCKEACRSALKKQTSVDLDRLQENLDSAGCQPVSFHDKMWQCFLRSNQDPPIGDYGLPKMGAVKPSNGLRKPSNTRVGVNDAKLYCCSKAATSHCLKLCTKIFTNDFDWESYERTCGTPQEENMNQCLDEVSEPCQPGCKNLDFCTVFNNRPLELFRSCSADSDKAAKADYESWIRERKITLPNTDPLYVKNIEECTPITWKTVACALQLKPCEKRSQSTRICKSSCWKLLDVCLDETKLRRTSKRSKIAEVCNKLASTSPDDMNCVSLDPFLEQMGDNSTDEYTTPCIPDNCGPAKFCEVNHHCPKGSKMCNQTSCRSGCPVGQVAAYLVPTDEFVPIPTQITGKSCFKICQCKGRITDCETLICRPQDYCTIHPDSEIDLTSTTEIVDETHTQIERRHWTSTIPSLSRTTNEYPIMREHGSTLYVKCNLCICYGGEIACSKRNCNETIADFSEPSFFRLPCNCEPKYEPVCTALGLTLQNECIAQCFGYQYMPGECTNINSCIDELSKPTCPRCMKDPKVCFVTDRAHECLQHQCVATSGCSYLPDDPVCDEDGKTHLNPCFMFDEGKKLAYKGPCLPYCKDSIVCGVDGNNYPSNCHATARFISIDYDGPCTGVGLINNETGQIEGCAKDLVCPALPALTKCDIFIPPGACCPLCTGAIRILFSQKQITRLYRATVRVPEFTVERIMKSLSRHIEVAECGLYGHLTMENDLIVLIKPSIEEPTDLHFQICAVEAEKLALLIQRGSPRVATAMTTSVLIYAKVVHYEHVLPGISNAVWPTPLLLVISVLVLTAQH